MAFNEILVNRVREALLKQEENITEKKMFGGLCFMVNGKMCVGVRNQELMCRINPEEAEIKLENGNCRAMVHGEKIIKGYIFVDDIGYKNPKDFQRLIDLCLDFNKMAKASIKQKR